MSKQDRKSTTEMNSGNGNEAALLEKIAEMEEALKEIQRFKLKRSVVGIVGLLLVLGALLLFLNNIRNFTKTKLNDADFQQEVLSTLSKDMKKVSETNPNVNLILQDMRNKIIPSLYKQVLERLKKETPKIKGVGKQMTDDLKNYLEKDLKAKLATSLSEAMLEVEDLLRKKYPNLSSKDIDKTLKSAQATFILELTEMLDHKLAGFSDDLGKLRTGMDEFKKCDEYKMLDPKNEDTIHTVKTQMVEAMLELVIYHINPQKGLEKVTPMTIQGDLK
jgi:hypothetical protein